ncbi:hypothetical protein [Nevskia ramosa]|uniref:hypothetical protein n=1 Tax=Nevskia ramosa TaxID=64002 RepID=UPI002353A3D4|nr:hypothetical protein [Nevskia ramosa]
MGLVVLLATSGCHAQSGQLDCPVGGKPIPREVLVGNWTWTDETNDGTHRYWLRQFTADGHVNLFVHAFTKPDAKWPNGLFNFRGTFGRWLIINRTWIVVMDGAYRGGDPLAEKFYAVNGPELPEGDAKIIGDITPDSIEVCFSNGQHYATMQRVDDKFVLPDHYPPRSGQ